MAKKGSSLAKIVVVFVALLMGLGFMGVGVSYWSDTLLISGTVETGIWQNTQLSCDGCSPGPDTTTWISCDVDDPYVVPHVMLVTVHNAEVEVYYSCQFHIYNGGTIPVKIQGIDWEFIEPLPSGVVNVDITVDDDQIDPEETEGGTVDVYLPAGSGSEGETFTFTVTIEVVQWNQ